MSDKRKDLEKFSAKIKHVLIQIKDFGFYHSPFSPEAPHGDQYDNRFIGRRKARQRIINILRNSRTQSGTYLVAGFRGMGKTSLVRMAIAEYNDEVLPTQPQHNRSLFSKGVSAIMKIIDFLVKIALICLLLILLFGPLTDSWGQKTTSLKTLLESYQEVVDSHWLIHLLTPLLICFCLFIIYSVTRSLLARAMKFIRHFIRYSKESNSKKAPYKLFEISLAEDRINEDNILKRLTIALLEYWETLHESNRSPWALRPLLHPVIGLNSLFNKQHKAATLASIEDELRTLSLRISSKLSEQGNGVSGPQLSLGTSTFLGRLALPFRFAGRNQTYSYDFATGKEIEELLIGILKRIDAIRQSNPKLNIPKFIFVIDELDKIEIPGVLSPPNGSKEALQAEYDPIYTPDSTLTRRRQQALAALLGNLKNFLNVARAKFVFIGGRELYEASLADIADRDSFYSSIFNQTIYVESFFKDKIASRGGITQITEAYLCKLLLGDPFRLKLGETDDDQTSFSLKDVYQHLRVVDGQITISTNRKENYRPNNFEDRLKLYKVIFLLQNYIIYLTYRSNGTPKKLASLIESSMVPLQALEERPSFSTDGQDKGLIVRQEEDGNESDIQYLRFRFDFQYEINLTAEIYRPFLIVNSRYLKTLGDKLLFSSTFIFDHILKFHPYGFSWRHLEMIPEIILVNREPNLREYVTDLLQFLLKNNIRESVSGLFQYRFYNKVQTELSYLSKISDLSSAAFNFTLDESLQIKKHYRNKLSILQEKYKGYRPSREDNHFVHSIYFVQAILGDLHFYDQEYDEAMIYYTESIQTLRLPMKDPDRVTSHQFALWMRSKLKCALTLEKMRNYDSALFHYTSLNHALLQDAQTKWHRTSILNQHTRNMQMVGLPLLGTLTVIEKSRTDGITYANIRSAELGMMKLLRFSQRLSPLEKKNVDQLRKLVCLGDFYNNLGGLLHYKNCQYQDMYEDFTKMEVREGEYKTQGDKKIVFPKLAYTILSEEKLGNPPYQKSKVAVEINLIRDEIKKEPIQPGLAAFIYYYRSLHIMVAPHQITIDKDLVENINWRSQSIKETTQASCPIASASCYLLQKNEQLINATKFYYLANVISRIGDAILGCISDVADGSGDYASELTNMASDSNADEDRDKNTMSVIQKIFELECIHKEEKKLHFFTLESVFSLYRLAASFYHKAGKERSNGFQLRKMLFVIKDSVILYQNKIRLEAVSSPNTPAESKGYLKIEDRNKIISACEYLSEQIFKFVSRSVDNAGRPQVLKYQAMLGLAGTAMQEDRPLLYQNLSVSSDIKEAIIITEQIRVLLMTSEKQPNYITNSNRFVSPYGSVSNRYVRMFELEYTALKYEAQIRKFRYEDFNSSNKSINDFENAYAQKKSFLEATLILKREQCGNAEIHFMIKESIFALTEVIKSIHIYGLNNFVSYSYLARIHKQLAFWCQLHVQCLKHQEANLELHYGMYIKKHLGGFALTYLEPRYHFELAAQSYQKAVSYHTEGAVYRNVMHKLYALEDDYNDNLRHFVTAIERYRFNTQYVRDEQREIKYYLSKSKLYKYESYFSKKGS